MIRSQSVQMHNAHWVDRTVNVKFASAIQHAESIVTRGLAAAPAGRSAIAPTSGVKSSTIMLHHG
jgi:hypothetical protein